MAQIVAHPLTVERSTAHSLMALRTGEVLSGGASFDIYVDSVNGSDSNDGLTEATALETLGAAQIAAVSVGDGVSIGLVAGSVWREGLALSTLSNVTLSGVGDFADGLPVLRGDEVVSGTWDTSADRADSNTNTFSQSLTTEANGMPMIMEDDRPLTWQSSIANVDANPGSFYVSGGSGVLTAGPFTFYVHPRSSTNANSDGKTYSFSTLQAPSFGDSTSVSLVRFGPYVTRSGLSVGADSLMRGVLFSRVSPVHECILKSGEYRDCAVWHDFDDAREGHLAIEFFDSSGEGKTGIYRRCVGYADSPSQNSSLIGGHVSGGNPLYDKIEVIDCSALDCKFTLTSVTDVVEVTRCHVKGSAADVMSDELMRFEGDSGITVTDCWTEQEEGSKAIRFDSDATVEGFRCYGNFSDGAIRIRGNLTLDRSVIVLSNATGLTRGPVDDNAANNTAMTGCILDNNGDFWTSIVYANTATGSDRNVLYSGGNNFAYRLTAGTYQNLSALQAAQSIEQNSVNSDPQIADAANGDFSAGAAGLPANCGLERPSITYTPIPASLAAAEQWIIDNAA